MKDILLSALVRLMAAFAAGALRLAKMIARHFIERIAVFAVITTIAAFVTVATPEMSWAETFKVVYSEIVEAIKKTISEYAT